jgi:hypothetical protein
MVRFIFIMLLATFAGTAMAETKTAIRPSELNPKIRNDIEKNYPGYIVMEAFKVNNKGMVTYEAIIQKNKDRLHLYYSVDGVFLRKELPHQNKQAGKKMPSKYSSG